MKLIMLLLLFVFLGCQDKEDKQSQIVQQVTENTELELKTNTQTTLFISNISSKAPLQDLFINSAHDLTMLFFFTTWCEPCERMIPHLQNLQAQFEGRLEIVGIVMDEFIESLEDGMEIQEYTKEHRITFPIITNKHEAQFFQNRIKAIPTLVLYDKKGHYLLDYLGVIPEEMLEFDITQYLP